MSSADASLLTPRSARVKAARKLLRRELRAEQRLFLAEGPQAVREALSVSGCVREVLAVPSAGTTHAELIGAARTARVPWHLLDDAALSSLTQTVQPQGLVAVCGFVDSSVEEVVAGGPLLVVCADVRDPGNAGTVIRSADAAGASGVLLTGSSVDPYNGKTVRATAGSLFHLPLALDADTERVLGLLRARGIQVLAADGTGEVDLDDAVDDGSLSRPTAWLFGNEAWGLPTGLSALADHRVRIPIHGRAESINLAAAAAVCLYASARAQRRPTR
ncbi:RNA methyltransferase [soil metagenome]